MGEAEWHEACADDWRDDLLRAQPPPSQPPPRPRGTQGVESTSGSTRAAAALEEAAETEEEAGAEEAGTEAAAVVKEAVAAALEQTEGSAAGLPVAAAAGLDFNSYVLSFFEIADLWTDCVCEVGALASAPTRAAAPAPSDYSPYSPRVLPHDCSC